MPLTTDKIAFTIRIPARLATAVDVLHEAICKKLPAPAGHLSRNEFLVFLLERVVAREAAAIRKKRR